MFELVIWVQLLINGLLTSAVYTMSAFGLALIFGVSGLLNLAHGDFLMLGGMGLYLLASVLGLNPFLGLLIVAPVFFLLGYGMSYSLFSPLRHRAENIKLTSTILISLGLSLIVSDVVAYFSLDSQFEKSLDIFLPTFSLGPVMIPGLKAVVGGMVVLLLLCLGWFLYRTKWGMAVRAVSQQREGASLMGVRPERIDALAFGLGILLAGTAGGFELLHHLVEPNMGLPLTLKYLSIIILGGLGSFTGVALGSLIIGLGESVISFYYPAWSDIVAYALLVGVLFLRPQGLLGRTFRSA